jgi:hypothetical protein
MTRIIELADGSQITAAQFRSQNPRVQYGGKFPLVAYLETIGASIVTITPTDAERRAAMAPISPLQGILTLGETEWGKVLTYRDTASWAEKVIIDNAADWVRTSQNIAFFGYLLEYTDEQMDALFTQAAQVTA